MAATPGGLLLKGAFLVPVLVSFTVSFTDVSICGGNFTAAQGVIESPNYPGNYSNNLDCAYVITQLVGYRIILTFTYFQVEAGPRCSYDFIEIRDGDSENSPLLLGRTCGWTTPYPQKSTQNNMFIRFKTDSSVTRIGFSAAFRAGVVPHEMMLATFEESIVRMDMETLSYINIPISNLRQPAAIDYDPVGDRIYWTDLVTNGIQCAFLNGSNTTVLKNLGLVASPQGLAVDSKSRLLFYTDAGTNVIGMLTLSGLYHKYLIDTELEQPRDIVLDNRNGTLFWTDWGKTAKIERSNYDGSDRQIIVSANLTSPNGLAIDMANDRLYWTDSGTDLVESSDFNGNQRRVIFYVAGSTFLGLSLFKTELYITDWIRSSQYVSLMRRVNIDGTHPAIIFSVDARLDNVHMYSEYTDKQGLNGCGLNNGGCSHFCLPLSGNKSMCACPDRQELNATLNKCEPAHDVCSVNNGGCSHFCLALTRNTSKCSCPDGLLLDSDEKNCSLGCGGTFTNLTGVITSPKYPSNYPNRADCVYLIQQPEGLRITLTFQDFQLQEGSNCVFDYLEIRDGGLPTSPLLHLSYCGSSAPSVQRSNQNQMWLHFKSDSSQTFRGFMASYNASYIPHQFMLVTFETTILRINIETLNYIRIPASNLTQPVAVDYDPDKDRLYWTDLARQEVRSAFLNGTNTTLLRSLGSAAAPYGLAVDSKSSLLFYTDAGNDHIAMISTRGLTSNFYHKILVNSSLDSPQAIVLDVMNGFMYWTDVGKDKKIERANYDGSERITLVNTSMSYPNALALDNDKNLLYWVDSVRLQVSVLDLNSWQRKVIFQTWNRFFYGLALHKTQLYITDWKIIGTDLYQTFIIRMNTDGSNASIIINGYGQLRDIHVYSSDMENKEPNGCGVNNGGCSHMCIPRTNKSSTCLCPDGWVLAADGKTCIYNSSFPQSTTTTSATTPAATASVASVTVVTSSSPLKTSISSAVSLNVSDSVATATVFPVTTSGPTIRITSYPLSTKGTTTTTAAPSLITSELYSLTGSEKLTLTCQSGGLENVINYKWNETCSGQQDQKTCTVVPKPPWDDGKAITCTAQNALGEKRVSIFILDLKYPPNAPEITVTAASGHALQIGDAVSLACKIRGGKPLVSKVTFTCTGYPDNVTDVFYTTEVMSVLNIKSLRSSDNGAVCNCTAVWVEEELYSLKAATTLNVSGSEPFNNHQVGSSVIGAAVGSIIAIFIVIAAIIVVLIILRNKGLVFWNRPERLVEDNLSYSNLESRSAAQETGYDQMKTDTSSYSQPDYFDFGFLTEATTDDTLQPGTAVRPEPAPTNPDNDHTYATVKY